MEIDVKEFKINFYKTFSVKGAQGITDEKGQNDEDFDFWAYMDEIVFKRCCAYFSEIEKNH